MDSLALDLFVEAAEAGKKLRVVSQWALDVVFERDLGQYVTLRDVASLNRLLEAAKKTEAAGA